MTCTQTFGLLLFAASTTVAVAGNASAADTDVVDGDDEYRHFGPFWEYSTNKEEGYWFAALRPFVSEVHKEGDGFIREILWPLATRKYRNNRLQQRTLTYLHVDYDTGQPAGAQVRWLLPFVFSGRTDDGRRYFALFPLGGQMLDFAGYDRIMFWGFPLYMQAEKGPYKSTNWLWPVFGKTDSEKVRKRRIFPFWGCSETIGQWRDSFVLWPLFTWSRPLNDEIKGGGFFVMPLFGRLHYEEKNSDRYRDTTSILWPFFTRMRTEHGTRWHCPWPFVAVEKNLTGDGDSKVSLWPFWGRRVADQEASWFVLWPIYRHYAPAVAGGRQENRRLYVLPFYWAYDEKRPAGRSSYYRRLWPLLSISGDNDGNRRLRLIDWWPQRHAPPVDRNWAPFWTFYHHEASKDERRHELLWGLWRYRRAAKNSRFSLLGGLYDRRREGDKSFTRVLWLLKF